MTKGSELTPRQEFWLGHLRACGEGSLKAYAQAHGLEVRALYDARARLKRKGVLAPGAARLVRVERARSSGGGPAYCRVHFPNGVSIELGCEPEHWGSLFTSVAALA